MPGLNLPDLKALFQSMIGQSAPGGGAAYFSALQNARRVARGSKPFGGRSAAARGVEAPPGTTPEAHGALPAVAPNLLETLAGLLGDAAPQPAADFSIMPIPQGGGGRFYSGLPGQAAAAPSRAEQFPMLRGLVDKGNQMLPYPGLPAV